MNKEFLENNTYKPQLDESLKIDINVLLSVLMRSDLVLKRNRNYANSFYKLSPLSTAITRFWSLSQDFQRVKSKPAGKERNTLIAIVHVEISLA